MGWPYMSLYLSPRLRYVTTNRTSYLLVLASY